MDKGISSFHSVTGLAFSEGLLKELASYVRDKVAQSFLVTLCWLKAQYMYCC